MLFSWLSFLTSSAQFVLYSSSDLFLVTMSTPNDVYQTPLNSRYASKSSQWCSYEERLRASGSIFVLTELG